MKADETNSCFLREKSVKSLVWPEPSKFIEQSRVHKYIHTCTVIWFETNVSKLIQWWKDIFQQMMLEKLHIWKNKNQTLPLHHLQKSIQNGSLT